MCGCVMRYAGLQAGEACWYRHSAELLEAFEGEVLPEVKRPSPSYLSWSSFSNQNESLSYGSHHENFARKKIRVSDQMLHYATSISTGSSASNAADGLPFRQRTVLWFRSPAPTA